jgi:hypothetical protein
MRMWMVSPQKMCRQHLLGEHLEVHMFVGCLNKNKGVNGYLEKGLLEIHNLRKRHNQLAKEMTRRGFSHNSDLPNYKQRFGGKINRRLSRLELVKRCKNCNLVNA